MRNFLADDDLGPWAAAGLAGISSSPCRCEGQCGPPGSGRALTMPAGDLSRYPGSSKTPVPIFGLWLENNRGAAAEASPGVPQVHGGNVAQDRLDKDHPARPRTQGPAVFLPESSGSQSVVPEAVASASRSGSVPTSGVGSCERGG